MHSPKSHESGVIAESDGGGSWYWAATRKQASVRYVELLERLESKDLRHTTTVRLVYQGRVVDETVVPPTGSQA